MTEGIVLLVAKGAGNEVECEVEIRQGEKREEQLHELIEKLDLEQYLPPKRVVRPPYLPELYQRVNRREEGAVKPAPPLRYELRYTIWNICLAHSAFHKSQHPLFVSLSD